MGTPQSRLNEAVLTCSPNPCFRAKIRKISRFFYLKIIVFTALINCSILHRRVCVMCNFNPDVPSLTMSLKRIACDNASLTTGK